MAILNTKAMNTMSEHNEKKYNVDKERSKLGDKPSTDNFQIINNLRY